MMFEGQPQTQLKANLEAISIRDKKTKLAKAGLVILLIAFTGYAAYDYFLPAQYWDWDGGLSPAEGADLEGEYYSGNETLDITVTDGEFTRKSGRVAFRSHLDGDYINTDNTPSESNFTIKSGDKTRETHIWAEKSVLGTGIGNSGITNFPIEEGESITILSDGEDRDGDGNEGIENGDVIVMIGKDSGMNARIEIFTVENNSISKGWQMKDN